MVAKQSPKISEMHEVVKRLDALIAVTLDYVGREGESTTRDKILTLKSAGLGPSDIGRILGVATSYVTATLAQTKKKKTEKGPVEKSTLEGQ